MATSSKVLKQNSQEAVVRPLENFPASIWGERFTSFSFDKSVFEAYEKKVGMLAKDVREMLLNDATKASEKMCLINALHRLGVSRHFENDIEDQLENLFGLLNLQHADECDLYNISIQFRVFRQHGFKMPCDVFNRFKNNTTGKFEGTLASDIKGILSFYEATELRLRGEDILDEAVTFTTGHLKSMVTDLSPSLAKQVKQALRRTFHKGMPRVETRSYISVYEEDNSRNELVLKLAKLDFNMLQMLHQQELSHISKWWKDLEFATKASHVRDRVVECYFWLLGVYFEPQYSFGRVINAKIAAVLTVIDDTYDAYGTFEELHLFTNAVNRWDICAIDQLPGYMKFCYRMLINLYDEINDEMAKQGRSYSGYHATQAMKQIIRAYNQEAIWLNSGYIPNFEEYMKNALITSGYHLMTASSFMGMGDLISKDTFEWLLSRPKIIIAAETIARLQDDLVTHEHEQERGSVASGVECYMKQYDVSKEVVRKEFEKRIINAWKDMNEDFLKPTAVSVHILLRVLNLARMIDVIYKYDDGFTHSEKIKEYISAVLMDPIPI